MKAVVLSGGRALWEDRAAPVAGPDELLVRVLAAGVNAADLLQRAGRYPPPPGTPEDQPGLECAGLVEQVGEKVTAFKPGDRVMSLLPGAAQAELAVVHERLAMAVPAGVDVVQAGGFPEAFSTACDALFTQAGLCLGERLLVTGAAGGVGTAAVQLAVAAGAAVVASVRDRGLHGQVAALGATCVSPESARDLGPYDVVLDLVGGPAFGAALNSLAPWGRAVVIGTGAGAKVDLDLHLLMSKRATLRGSTLRNRPLEQKVAVARSTERHALTLLESGRLRVAVAATYPFQQVQEAYERFAAGSKFGKVVLVREA